MLAEYIVLLLISRGFNPSALQLSPAGLLPASLKIEHKQILRMF